jgi:hypothetical protein
MAGEEQNAEETAEKIAKLILNKFPYVKQELKQVHFLGIPFLLSFLYGNWNWNFINVQWPK